MIDIKPFYRPANKVKEPFTALLESKNNNKVALFCHIFMTGHGKIQTGHVTVNLVNQLAQINKDTIVQGYKKFLISLLVVSAYFNKNI